MEDRLAAKVTRIVRGDVRSFGPSDTLPPDMSVEERYNPLIKAKDQAEFDAWLRRLIDRHGGTRQSAIRVIRSGARAVASASGQPARDALEDFLASSAVHPVTGQG